MRDTIKTPTGNTYEVSKCATIRQTYNSVLFIEFVSESLMEAVVRFSDPNETAVIYEYYDDTPVKTLVGYTNLTEAFISDGKVTIRLETPMPELPEPTTYILPPPNTSSEAT